MLIISFMVSMSALAFEVNFGGSEDKEAVATNIAIATMTGFDNGYMTGVTAVGTVSPDFTYVFPEFTNTYPEQEVTKAPQGENTWVDKEEAKPEYRNPIYVEGADTVSCGMYVGYSVMITDPIAVKSGAISIEYDHEIFTLDYASWYLPDSPVISHVNYEQSNGVFAYAEPAHLTGEVFYVSFYVNYGIPYGYTGITFDLILKDENQKDVEVEDPHMSVYVGCNSHYYEAIVRDSALAKYATCNSYADYYYSCANCGHNDYSSRFTYYEGGYAEHEISKHWHVDEETHWHGCSYCHEVDTDKGEHTFGKWVTVKEATKEEPGLKECSCTVCGFTKSETVKYKNPNKVDTDTTEEPETTTPVTEATTAAQGGNTIINISGCGASVSLSAIAILPILATGAAIIKKKED